jgi:uncharacterized protein
MKLFLSGPSGRLEAKLWLPSDETAVRAAAVVCHPHPLGGGTMDNNVVFRIARGLQSAGLAVLRFNFRGAGESEGAHDGHGGEELDAQAASAWLAQRFPDAALWAAGFSFGARTVAALAAREPRIERLLCVAMPCKQFDCSALRRIRVPALILMAGADGYGTLADLRALLPDLPANVETDEIAGVDHFFKGQTPELEARIRRYAERALEMAR